MSFRLQRAAPARVRHAFGDAVEGILCAPSPLVRRHRTQTSEVDARHAERWTSRGVIAPASGRARARYTASHEPRTSAQSYRPDFSCAAAASCRAYVGAFEELDDSRGDRICVVRQGEQSITPSVTTAGTPPTHVETTGRPLAKASRIDSGMLSMAGVWT